MQERDQRASSGKGRGNQRGLRRHLDGWQAGALLLLLASSAVFLAVPRGVVPEQLPLPVVDHRALQATIGQDERWAREAEHNPLDFDIRAVGRELRAYNRAAALGDHDEFVLARRRVLKATARALGRSEAELLQLRAYQTIRFVVELRRWRQTGVESDELKELGGDFLRSVRRNRWCTGSNRELIMDDQLLHVVYKKRWNDIAGVGGKAFALSLDEERLRYGFFIRYPAIRGSWELGEGELARSLRRGRATVARLEYVEKLAAIDQRYPAFLAQGVLLYRMRKYGAAVDAFRNHLEQTPDGPYALRAQNYLKAALDQTRHGLF